MWILIFFSVPRVLTECDLASWIPDCLLCACGITPPHGVLGELNVMILTSINDLILILFTYIHSIQPVQTPGPFSFLYLPPQINSFPPSPSFLFQSTAKDGGAVMTVADGPER